MKLSFTKQTLFAFILPQFHSVFWANSILSFLRKNRTGLSVPIFFAQKQKRISAPIPFAGQFVPFCNRFGQKAGFLYVSILNLKKFNNVCV